MTKRKAPSEVHGDMDVAGGFPITKQILTISNHLYVKIMPSTDNLGMLQPASNGARRHVKF